MEKSTKIIVTIIIVVVFIVLSAVVTGIRSDAGAATPGILEKTEQTQPGRR